MIAFIDAHRDRFGVEPICRLLREHGCGIAPNTYWAAKQRPPSKRAVRDVELSVEIQGAYAPLASGFNYEKLGVVPKKPADLR